MLCPLVCWLTPKCTNTTDMTSVSHLHPSPAAFQRLHTPVMTKVFRVIVFFICIVSIHYVSEKKTKVRGKCEKKLLFCCRRNIYFLLFYPGNHLVTLSVCLFRVSWPRGWEPLHYTLQWPWNTGCQVSINIVYFKTIQYFKTFQKVILFFVLFLERQYTPMCHNMNTTDFSFPLFFNTKTPCWTVTEVFLQF